LGPANLPAEITNKLNAAIVAAMTNPGIREQLQNEGAMPVGNSATEFAAFVRRPTLGTDCEAVGCEA
jgi:tripartite-type tricarboxylate transporter receptor subunit TctC